MKPFDKPPIPEEFREHAEAYLASTAFTLEPEKPADREIVREYDKRIIQAYASRMLDGLKLYKPLPAADPFHASMARTRLFSGGNQVGKSTVGATEFARISRGMDPYRKRVGKKLNMLVVGKDAEHLADPIWTKVALPGAFSIVPDEITGVYRAVRPDPKDHTEIDPIDMERKGQWLPSPPLIPPNEIVSIAWEDKKAGIPKRIKIKNRFVETDVLFASGLGKTRQGVQYDFVWADEEIENKNWLAELQPRLLLRNGIWVWTFTPQAATIVAAKLHELVVAGAEGIEEFSMSLDDTPYISKPAKKAMLTELEAMGEEEVQVRYYGVYAITARKVYPEFNQDKHVVGSFQIPADWMRLFALDPGTQVCCIMCAAVPPNGQELHFYRELILKNVNATDAAEAIQSVTQGFKWETFLIDQKAGQQRTMGWEQTVADHYYEEMKKLGVESRLSSSGFTWGSSDVESRTLCVRALMQDRPGMGPALKIHRETCPQLIRQIQHQYFRKDRPDKREDLRKGSDAVDAAEYVAAYFGTGLYYVAPEKSEMKAISPVYQAFLNKQDRAKKRERMAYRIDHFEAILDGQDVFV